MLERQESTTRAQDAFCLAHRLTVVGDGTERKRADDRVEVLVGKVKGLGVADPKIRLAPQLLRSLSGDLKHWLTQVDAGQTDALRVILKVSSRSDADL